MIHPLPLTIMGVILLLAGLAIRYKSLKGNFTAEALQGWNGLALTGGLC